jgi:prepilin-type N-terminal cleavage/methylation domain-containing protein
LYYDYACSILKNMSKKSDGFTIVELLVVIVVIGILAAITIVAYRGIAQKATEASLVSDLDNASKQLKLFFAENDTYPATLNCSLPDSTTNKCIKSSNGNAYTEYQVDNNSSAPNFRLSSVNNGITSYRVTSDSAPIACPVGFIVVPGSKTYGTIDFCVMKYEAKDTGGGKPASIMNEKPWVDVSQDSAKIYSKNVIGCPDCHLISEAEWLTIAQDVISVPGNWSGNVVGSGYIYGGHNDGTPANSLAASTDDKGYSDTGETSGNQRRTLTLTNGEIIWDLAGNVREWTSGQVTGGQPGIVGSGYAWREWTGGLTYGTMSPDPHPGYVNPLGGSWNSDQGIGRTWLSSDDTGLKVLVRSGYWDDGEDNAGVLMLGSGYATSSVSPTIGFRVAR